MDDILFLMFFILILYFILMIELSLNQLIDEIKKLIKTLNKGEKYE